MQYAAHLYKSKKYENAAKEYERLVFFHPNNDSLIFNLSCSYIHSKQYDKALAIIKPKISSNSIFLNHYPDILLLTGQYVQVDSFCSSNKNFSDQQKYIFNERVLLCSGDWKKLKEVSQQTKEKEKFIFAETKGFHRKSPVLALGLSVVPGLGKVYTHNFTDAAMSFFTVGICSFLAYRGFNKKGIESAPGWFYGGLGTGLYLGNFYGGFKAAKTYTKNFRDHIKKEMEDLIISEYENN